MRKVMRWLPLLVVLTNVVLVRADVLDVGQAVVVVLLAEAVLGVVAIAMLATARTAYREARDEGLSRQAAVGRVADSVLPPPVVALARAELRAVRAVVRLVRRR